MDQLYVLIKISVNSIKFMAVIIFCYTGIRSVGVCGGGNLIACALIAGKACQGNYLRRPLLILLPNKTGSYNV